MDLNQEHNRNAIISSEPTRLSRFTKLPLILVALTFGILGTWLIYRSFAATTHTATPATFIGVMKSAQPGDTILLSPSTSTYDLDTYNDGDQIPLKSGTVTIKGASANRADTKLDINLRPATNLVFDNVTIVEGDIEGQTTKNIAIQNSDIIATIHFRAASLQNANIMIKNNVVRDFDVTKCSGCSEGVLWISNRTTQDVGLTIQNNEFTNILGDGVKSGGKGVKILNNVFHDFREGTTAGAHSDAIQLESAHNNIIDGNYFYAGPAGPNSSGSYITAGDGDNIGHMISNNVFANGPVDDDLQIAGHDGTKIVHNTFMNSVTKLVIKPVNTENNTTAKNMVVQDNIFANGAMFFDQGCSSCTLGHNMFTTSTNVNYSGSPAWPGTNNVIASPTFVGGTNPTTLASYALTNASAGKAGSSTQATDGKDMGPGSFTAGIIAESSSCNITVNTATAIQTEAAKASNEGKVVCVAAGTYNGVVIHDITHPANNKVTIRSENPRTTVLRGIVVQKVTGLRIENFKVQGGTITNNTGDHRFNPITDIDFVGNDIGGGGFTNTGFNLFCAITNVTIENNYIHDINDTLGDDGWGGYGIRLNANPDDVGCGWRKNIKILYNTLERTHNDAMDIGGSDGGELIGNIVRDINPGPEDPSEHSDSLMFWAGSKNFTFRDNRYSDSHDMWLLSGGTSGMTIENNLIVRGGQWGISSGSAGSSQAGLHNSVFRNNTIWGTGGNWNDQCSPTGLGRTGTADDTNCMGHVIQGASTKTNIVDHNIYDSLAGSCNYISGGNYNVIASGPTNSLRCGSNDLAVIPQFANKVDYQPTNFGNAADGKPIGYRVARAGHDWGASTPPPPPPPTAAVSLSASPTSVTTGGLSTLTWSTANVASCTASGAWSGPKATGSNQTGSTGILNTAGPQTYTITCAAASGATPASVTDSATVTVTAPAPPVTGGLILALGFNEGAGTTLADNSGQNNNGTASNTTWNTTGKFGKSLSFNGSSSRVNVPDSSSLDLITSLTLEAWVNPTASGGCGGLPFSKKPAAVLPMACIQVPIAPTPAAT